jgi:gamma-glutamyltranspeptidase
MRLKWTPVPILNVSSEKINKVNIETAVKGVLVMQQKWGIRGMAVAPHSLASESALAVLREGGNALEAMVAAAATIAVVYPHMNSITLPARLWAVLMPVEQQLA